MISCFVAPFEDKGLEIWIKREAANWFNQFETLLTYRRAFA